MKFLSCLGSAFALVDGDGLLFEKTSFGSFGSKRERIHVEANGHTMGLATAFWFVLPLLRKRLFLSDCRNSLTALPSSTDKILLPLIVRLPPREGRPTGGVGIR